MRDPHSVRGITVFRPAFCAGSRNTDLSATYRALLYGDLHRTQRSTVALNGTCPIQIGFVLVRPEGACHQRRRIPPRELSIDLVADERLGRVTGRAEAS